MLKGLGRTGAPGRFVGAIAMALANLIVVPQVRGADYTVRDVTSALFKASRDTPVDFADANLSLLDLSKLDFKRSVLTGADLYGSDLTGSSLVGADLSGTRLDRATIIGADFSEANLEDATLLRPTTGTGVTYAGPDFDVAQMARFARAKMARVHIIARLERADFRGADLTGARFTPVVTRSNTIATTPFSELAGADFSQATLVGVEMTKADLRFARFHRADLSGADLREARLARADFTGADLTGADLTGAEIEGAIFDGAKGLETVKGMDMAVSPAGEAGR
ncbi:MAG: pentapeptide repeat-containing protein [Hyphomicrobiaceae bacterium]|nr:pentapeptide repeat-containing protein [Hyphomicrobiaceae bacterium]